MKYFRLIHISTIIFIFIINLFFTDLTKNLTHNISLFSYSSFNEFYTKSTVNFLMFLSMLICSFFNEDNKTFKFLFSVLIAINISIIIMYFHQF